MMDETIKKIEDTVLRHYLRIREPLTLTEIMDWSGLGKTIIKRALDENSRIELSQKYVEIYSEKNPTIIYQRRLIDAYQPTRRWLCELLSEVINKGAYQQGTAFTGSYNLGDDKS